MSTVSTRVHDQRACPSKGGVFPLDTGHGTADTVVVLAPGWSLWVEDRLLVEGEPLDHLDEVAQAEWVRQGRAVIAHTKTQEAA